MLGLKRTPNTWSAARISAGLVLLLAGISAIVLISAFHGLQVQSWIRAYTTGEALWSKAQKDAVIALVQYADTGQTEHLRWYEDEIRVPLGDRAAREELELARPNLERASRGFIDGRNHPDDIAGLITLFRQFRNMSYVDRAIDIWAEGDRAISELDALAGELRTEVASGSQDPVHTRDLVDAVLAVNARLSGLEEEFSETLGAAARWTHAVMTGVIVGGGLLLLSIVSVGCWLLANRVRLAERRLVESEEGFRSIIENAVYGILRCRADGTFLAANPALAQMLGYESVEELARRKMPELYAHPEDYRLLVEDHDDQTAAAGIVTRWKKKDGTIITVRLSGRRFRGSGTPGAFEMIVENVTERRLLEEQLRQAQKMEAVGQLTGGIAHDLNNLLTTIITNADLAQSSLDSRTPQVRDKIADVRDAARRGAQMIRKLLAFSRQETLALRPIDLGATVRESLRVLERLLPEHIELEAVIGDNVVAAADAGAVEQMLVNLATNARDAMPEHGKLTITLDRVQLTNEDCRSHGCGAGPYVRLAVRDTGTGIPQDIMERIFEPFFTTKPRGLGTGLGMPMIYGLVKQHGGFVELKSGPEPGTLVQLYLPAADDATRLEDASERDDVPATSSGSETILVVEDNDGVRRAASRVLQSLGYRTLTATDGVDALATLDRHPGVDLAIVDVVMPRMSGRDFRDRLRARGETVPIVFMSGYTGEEHSVADLGDDAQFLAKPWTTHELATTIRAALDLARPPVSTHGQG